MKEVIVHKHPKSPISEAYRGIRTNIQFANVDKAIKTILVTSPTPGEGKTTTLANIAATMAQNRNKVLIIDADMRKPRLHKALEINNNKGLADLLLERGPTKDYIQRHQELGVDVLTSGHIPSNPSELVQSKAMKQLIESLKEEYEYIFLDTPPVLPVTDSTIMSTYIDSVILVVRAGEVNREVVNKAKNALINVGANILGVVLNRIKVKDSKAYHSYYYYYADDKEHKQHRPRNFIKE